VRKLLLLFLVLSASDLFAGSFTNGQFYQHPSFPELSYNWNKSIEYTVSGGSLAWSYSTSGTYFPSMEQDCLVVVTAGGTVYDSPGSLPLSVPQFFPVQVKSWDAIFGFVVIGTINADGSIDDPNAPELVYIDVTPQTYTNTTDQVLYLEFQDQFYQVSPGDSVTVQSSDGQPMAAAWFTQNDLFLNSTLEIPEYQTFSTGADAGTGDVVTFEIEQGNIQDLELIIGQPTDLSASNTFNTIDNSTEENWITDNATGTISGKVINGIPTLFQPSSTPSIGTGTGEPGEGLNDYELAALDRINLRNEIELQAQSVGDSASSQGQAAASNEESLIPVVGSSMVVVNGAAPSFVINLPTRMGGASIDLNPFRSDRLGNVASGIRVFVTWLTFLTLSYFFATIIHDSLRDFNQAPQTHGNEVMGSGGQITALACAALLTAAVTIALVKVVSTITGDFAISSVYAQSQANPFAAMGGGIIWMLDQLFPLSIIVGCAVARLTLKTLSTAAYAVCAAVIRFIVL
jgi:hypothetical protein